MHNPETAKPEDVHFCVIDIEEAPQSPIGETDARNIGSGWGQNVAGGCVLLALAPAGDKP